MERSDDEELCEDGTSSMKKARLYQAEARPGGIERIRLVNFMCHAELIWNITKPINFVIGSNGSGKSSILQAIVLGLGGNAADTKRYTKVSEYIRKGCNKTVIEISLSNRGEDAYKPEVYGNRITFQRTIHIAKNRSEYLLKDEWDKRVDIPKQAHEQREILHHFHIGVNNPLVVLQQETAKELLNVSTPEKLYQLWIKAALFDEVRLHYQNACSEIRHLQVSVDQKKVRKDLLKEKWNHKKMKFDELKERLEKEKLCQVWEQKKAWREVLDLEAKYNEVDSVRENLGLEEEELKSKREKQRLKLKDVQDEQQVRMECLEKEKQKSKIEEDEVKLHRRNEHTLKNKIAEVKEKIRNEDAQKTDLENELEFRKKIFESSSDSDMIKQLRASKQESEEKQRKVEERIKKAEDKMNENIKKSTENDEKQERFLIQEKGIFEENARLMKEIKQLESGIQEIHSSDNPKNRLAFYGRARLITADIDKKDAQGCFKKKPIGPIGLHVRMKGNFDQRVVNMIEHALKNCLKSYICDNGEDARILRSILKKNNENAKVYVSRFLTSRHDIKYGVRELPNALRFLDCLEIDNVQVYNLLVDQLNMEGVVYCHTQSDAMKLVGGENPPPEYLETVYTGDKNRFHPARSGKNYRSYWENVHEASLISIKANNVDELEKRIKDKEKQIEENLQIIKEQKQQIQSEDESIKRYSSILRKDISMLKQEKTKLILEMNKITEKEMIDDEETYHRQRQELDNKLNNVELSLIQHRDTLQQLEYDRSKSEAQKVKAQKKVDEFRIIPQLQEEVDKIANRETIATKNIASTGEALKKIQKRQKDLLDERELLSTAITNKKEYALKMSNNVEMQPEESRAIIEANLFELRRRMGSPDQRIAQTLEKELRILTEQRRKVVLEYKTMKSRQEELNEQLADRKRAFAYIKSHCANSVMQGFRFLTESSHAEFGMSRLDLNINHNKHTATIQFINEEGNEMKKDLKTLSGGEKSYVQMCFILTMWESMVSPIRALDEWDVFLDAMNRKKISKYMLEKSLRQTHVQHIFISPQGATDDAQMKTSEARKLVDVMQIGETQRGYYVK